jgi:hypothetical protein
MQDASDPIGCQEAQAGKVRQKPLEQHSPTPLVTQISFPNVFLKLFHNYPKLPSSRMAQTHKILTRFVPSMMLTRRYRQRFLRFSGEAC